MKKCLSLLILLVMLFSLLVIPVSAEDSPVIFDLADLLTDVDEQIFTQDANKFMETYNCGLYIVTLNRITDLGHGENPEEALRLYYEEKGLGTGPEHSGMIMALSVDQNLLFLETMGQAEELLTEEDLNYLMSGSTHPFEEENWYVGFYTFLVRTDLTFRKIYAPEPTVPETEPATEPEIVPVSSLSPVADMADILTNEEESRLCTMAAEAAAQTGCGIYILTVEDYKALGYTGHIEHILRDIYHDNNFGTGTDRDGIILMLSMKERDYALYTNGFGNEGLTDFAKDLLVERFLDDFRVNLWYNGFEDYITCSQDFLQRTLKGKPVDENTVFAPARIVGILVCILLGAGAGKLIELYFVWQMKSVAIKTTADHFVAKEGLQLSEKDDRFTHTTTTRIYDPPSSSSGGSSHRSSGGSRSGGSRSGCSRSGKF